MTIRFSCTCGSTFEVSEDYVGRIGRCRRCGIEMTIPLSSDSGTAGRVSSVSEPSIQASASTSQRTDERLHLSQPASASRFCPFCGKETLANPVLCPHCFKTISRRDTGRSRGLGLSPADWILVTILAPLGLLGGFVNLILGNRKGLAMMGIATASIVIIWFVSFAAGVIR
jgi:hypothetical protein